MQSDLNLAVIGNCAWSGLLDRRGSLVWACFPRADGDPIFPALLDGGPGRDGDGTFTIELEDLVQSEQSYEQNTAIVTTTLRDRSGNALQIRDFAPRFVNYDRMFRPTTMIRRVMPLQGDPRIRIIIRPRCGYGGERPQRTRGSNHIRFVMPDFALRLTTDAPVSYVYEGIPFVLEREINMILGPDESLTGPVGAVARDFTERTHDYWSEWSRTLSIPFEWQEAVIRAAITLKLCSFEETGAIVAALTTSIPEAPDSGRNWDYRFCWLRDSYFVIQALNRLGATKTMEGYLGYITNIVAGLDGHLQPVYGIGLETRLTERIEPNLAGYRSMGPVRIGNQAWEHTQNDVYGSLVLAATQSFFDRRLLRPAGSKLFFALEHVGAQAVQRWNQPDAGIWEHRTRAEVHTFSAVMCWATCERLSRIGSHLGLPDRSAHWQAEATSIRSAILEQAWSERLGSFVHCLGEGEVDASLLQLHDLGFLEADDPRFVGTVNAVERELLRGGHVQRYAREDDLGRPTTAFNICTFWYIEALAALGRREEARELFENMLGCRSHLGLLSEDLDPVAGELWGNFPQTYSMVGLINSAMRLSKSWEDAL